MSQSDKVKIFEIKQYMIIWRQLEERAVGDATIKIRGLVRCIGDEYEMDVFFLAPDSPFPAPSYDMEAKKGAMYLPIADMAAFVDTLRNEKPIYGHLRADNPQWTSVTTTKEPVGEGENA